MARSESGILDQVLTSMQISIAQRIIFECVIGKLALNFPFVFPSEGRRDRKSSHTYMIDVGSIELPDENGMKFTIMMNGIYLDKDIALGQQDIGEIRSELIKFSGFNSQNLGSWSTVLITREPFNLKSSEFDDFSTTNMIFEIVKVK